MSHPKTRSAGMTREKAAAAAELMKRLANPTRLMIACVLAEGERSVGELETTLALKQPALSQQLAELREAGIVEARREVKQVFYRLSDPRAAALIKTLHQIFCGERREASPATIVRDPSRPARISPQPTRPCNGRPAEAARFARVAPPVALIDIGG